MNRQLELCCVCEALTGRAGQGEDSLYTDDGIGPYCEECWKDVERATEAIAEIEADPSCSMPVADFVKSLKLHN